MTNQYGQRLLLAVLLLCTLCFGAMAEQLQAEDTQAASFHSAKTEIVLVEDANILLKEGTSASYIVQVPEDGTYALAIGYSLNDDGNAAAEYSVEVDGALPCEQAASSTLPRLWQMEHAITQDEQGNDLRAPQVPYRAEQTCYVQDSSGMIQGPLLMQMS